MNLKELNFGCKTEDKIDNYKLGDEGCIEIFNSLKYLLCIVDLNLWGNKE